MANDRAGADNATFANRDPRQQHCTCSDIRPGFHAHRANFEIGFDDRSIDRDAGVGRAQYFRSRAPAHIILQNELPRIEVSLRPNPNVIANFGNSINAPLNVRLCSDENTIPDLKRFQVLEADAAPDPYPVTKFSRNRSPDGATHKMIQLAIAICEPGIVFEKHCWRTTGSQMTGQIQLEERIAFDLPFSVNRGNYAAFLPGIGGHS
jgi:hypothetical protein